MSDVDRPRITGRHRYRNAAGSGPARLGERETAARNDRIAQALRVDVTIDLRDVDTAHLLVEHRALASELRRYRQALVDIAEIGDASSEAIALEALGGRP